MKKLTSSLIAMAFVGAMALPAMADVDVTAVITKKKDKTVKESVEINKNHLIGVKQMATPTNSAEAQAIKNDVNTGNKLTEAPVPAKINDVNEGIMVPAVPITKNAAINSGAGDGSAGIVGINQAPGSMDNQGNATSVSVTKAGDAFVHAEASAEKINGGLVSGTEQAAPGNTVTANEITRTNTIDAALKNVAGILSVNQSAGSINNQDNAVAMSVGIGAIACLSEADLGMVNAMNTSTETGVALADTLSNGSLSGSRGIVSVNQSSGCMNNQANVVAVAVLTAAPL